jgi:hypothetical protein
MSDLTASSTQLQFGEALSSRDTLALLIPRIRVVLPVLKEKRRIKQVEELLSSLEELENILGFQEQHGTAMAEHADNPFIEGIPRCTFQVEAQFGHYVNPASAWRGAWLKQRLAVWDVFEKTIPWSVREALMSWRWCAELNAFRKMRDALEKSKKLVAFVELRLVDEERRGSEKVKRITIWDRLRIIFWARSTKKDEESLLALEQERDAISRGISERLNECERRAAATAIGIRTLFVDCGELYPRIFEDCCRALDREIKSIKESDINFSESKNSELVRDFEEKSRENFSSIRKTLDRKERILQAVEGRIDLQLADAERLLAHEFMCLNALELEKQENARNRWQRAVNQMKRVLQTAEENFANVESNARDADGDGSGRTSTSQIRI